MASGFTEESLLGVLPPARASLELRNELVAENKGLPDVIYQRYRGRVDRDELWSVCHEGLIAAVEGFDEGRGYKFTTYACRAMKSRLSRHLLEQATSRRQPLQLLTEWDSESCGVDIAANRRETLLSLGLRELVPMLTRRPADVISRRFGLFGPEETLEAIAKSYGITRERVRQIQDAALLELREMWDRRAAVS